MSPVAPVSAVPMEEVHQRAGQQQQVGPQAGHVTPVLAQQVELDLAGEYGAQPVLREGFTTDNGNLIGLVGSYQTTDGANHQMADVWFSRDASAGSSTTSQSNLISVGQPPVTAFTATASGATCWCRRRARPRASSSLCGKT